MKRSFLKHTNKTKYSLCSLLCNQPVNSEVIFYCPIILPTNYLAFKKQENKKEFFILTLIYNLTLKGSNLKKYIFK